MFEKVSQLAEQAAANTSRRSFLRHLGKGAVAAAGTVAMVLAAPRTAAAGRGVKCPRGYRKCSYVDRDEGRVFYCVPKGSPC